MFSLRVSSLSTNSHRVFKCMISPGKCTTISGAGRFRSLVGRGPSSVHHGLLATTSIRKHACVGGCPKVGNGATMGGVHMVHLSSVCLVTTRTTLGGSSTSRTDTGGCLGTVVGHTVPSTSSIATARTLILGREHGRLIVRNRHFCSVVHLKVAMAHGNKCRFLGGASLVSPDCRSCHAVLTVPRSRVSMGPGVGRGRKCFWRSGVRVEGELLFLCGDLFSFIAVVCGCLRVLRCC